jgi:hypothetical protein
MSDVHGETDSISQLAMLGARRFTESGRQVLNFSLNMQKAFLDEVAKASEETLERMRDEVDIASEFVARMASAHSVKEITTVYSDCGQHQADAFRLESQQLLKHSQHLCEQTSKFLTSTES